MSLKKRMFANLFSNIKKGGDFLPFTRSQIVRWIYAFTHLVVAEPAPFLTKNRIHERNIFNFNHLHIRLCFSDAEKEEYPREEYCICLKYSPKRNKKGMVYEAFNFERRYSKKLLKILPLYLRKETSLFFIHELVIVIPRKGNKDSK